MEVPISAKKFYKYPSYNVPKSIHLTAFCICICVCTDCYNRILNFVFARNVISYNGIYLYIYIYGTYNKLNCSGTGSEWALFAQLQNIVIQ